MHSIKKGDGRSAISTSSLLSSSSSRVRTTVQRVNKDTTRHTILATSPAGAVRSGTLPSEESFTHTFPHHFPKVSPDSSTKPGTYESLCEINPGMRASVTFSESGGKAHAREKSPPTQERDETTVQQPYTAPRTGDYHSL